MIFVLTMRGADIGKVIAPFNVVMQGPMLGSDFERLTVLPAITQEAFGNRVIGF